ncbi:MAG TPA: sporulation and cell division repeat protein [Acetobacteraceae bacterium]|nr:sporulation and cell division repeat protein [Acetobacteraceae bacterium]
MSRGVTSRSAWFLLPLTLLTFACTPQPKPDPHYVLGKPYQSGAVWFYPRESFDLDETGLASVAKGDTPRLTADGEVFDQTTLAAGHPTIQLPAIARLTNLENGREVTVRINDRGPGDPHRLVDITQRTATLLNIPAGGVARVRLRVLPAESHAAAEALPGAPSLAIAAAPRGGIQSADLAPPPGVRQGNSRALPAAAVAQPEQELAAAPPMRLPETVTQTPPKPGQLVVRLDTFDDYQYAAVQRAKMGWSNARIVSVFEGRTHRFLVEVGPMADVAQADAVLDRALASGIPDARIVVE